MTKKLLLLNLVLVGLIAWIGWYLRERWMGARQREWQTMTKQLHMVPPPPITPAVLPPPVQAASYSEVAQKLVFSKDRNPIVEVVVAPPPVMPPLPVAHGVFLFGDTPIVVLSDKPQSPHKSYRPGETIGEFKLVAVTNQEIEFEWQGKSIKRSLQQMLEEGSRVSGPPQAVQQAPSPAATATNLSSGKASGPPPGEGVRPCTSGDTTPAGSVVNGMKKVANQTPFGIVCRWEPVN